MVSVPGARALWLEEGSGDGPCAAFFAGREFAHLHPVCDGSLHTALPLPLTEMGTVTGIFVMIYGPGTDEELKVVYSLVLSSYSFASGSVDTVSTLDE